MMFEETTAVYERKDHKAMLNLPADWQLSQTPWLSLTQITPLPSYELPDVFDLHTFALYYDLFIFVYVVSDFIC